MGMYDHIRCERDLPELGLQPERVFQTKDTPEQWLAEYVIRADGSLWVKSYEAEEWECCPLTGGVSFYSFLEAPPGGRSGWVEFSSYFHKGNLKELHLMENTPPTPAQGVDSGAAGQTPQAAGPEGQEPGREAVRPTDVAKDEQGQTK
jgi:hypothetical protein